MIVRLGGGVSEVGGLWEIQRTRVEGIKYVSGGHGDRMLIVLTPTINYIIKLYSTVTFKNTHNLVLKDINLSNLQNIFSVLHGVI